MTPYRKLQQEVSDWFGSVRSRHAGEMRCGRGCVACCHGLFDISLPDALQVAEGVRLLPDAKRSEVESRARQIQAKIAAAAPDLHPPCVFGAADESRIDSIIARVPAARCPFLDRDDSCLIYEHRPMACRLEGIPMVDARDGLFGDWCELNFTEGVPPEVQQTLKRDYYDLWDQEKNATASVSERLLGERHEVLTVFIPSLLVHFEDHWARLLSRDDAAEKEHVPQS
jgi:Fe-S-cluster containining protein